MISDELQYQIHLGHQQAFQALFAQCGRGVYLTLLSALGEERIAREGVKQVFRLLRLELIAAPGPIDVEARIAALTGEQIARLRNAPQAASNAPTRSWAECFQDNATHSTATAAPVTTGEPMANVVPVTAGEPVASVVSVGSGETVVNVAPVAGMESPSASGRLDDLAPSEQMEEPVAAQQDIPQGEVAPADLAQEALDAPCRQDTPPTPSSGESCEELPSDPERPDAPAGQSEPPRPVTDGPGPCHAPHPKPRRGLVLLLWLVVVLLSAVLAWLLAGILMDIGLLPRCDLGYAWFNRTIFPVFRLQ